MTATGFFLPAPRGLVSRANTLSRLSTSPRRSVKAQEAKPTRLAASFSLHDRNGAKDDVQRRRVAVHAGQRYKNDRNLYGGNLQKAIKGASSVDEILDMVADNASFLDHIHCVTAVYRMAKLTQTSRKGRGRGGQGGGGANAAVRVDLLTDQRFEVLKVAIEGQINKFDSWATANLLYSFALLRCNPGYSLLDLLTGHAVSLGSLLSTVDVSNCCFAFQQLKYRPPPQVMTELWNVAVQNISIADGKTLAGLLDSVVKLGHKPSNESLTIVSDSLLYKWDEITPRVASNSFISFVRLGYLPGKDFLKSIDDKLQADFDHFSNRDIALCLSAFRLAKQIPSEVALGRVLAKVNSSFDEFNERDIVQILFSLSKLNVDPGLQNLQKTSNAMLSDPASCTGESTLRILDAYVSTGYEPSESFIDLVKQKNKKTNARSGQLIRRFK
jgi:hypothetical protein